MDSKNIVNLNTDNTDSNSNDFENETIQPTQLEMKEILISKIKKYNNVDIKIKEVTNNVGIFYAITAHVKLADVGNSVFHSATLKTVSYNKRIVNIKCVFSDNENLKHDMKINRDSLYQCFRDIAPDTITSISLEDFKDQSEKSHLRIIASTIKGASLIFVYKRLMDFVNIINEKYGNLVNTPITPDSIEIDKPIDKLVVKPIDKPVVKPIENPIENDKLDFSNINYIASENIIKDLDKEEKRLQLIIDNIRLLKQTQINYILQLNPLYNIIGKTDKIDKTDKTDKTENIENTRNTGNNVCSENKNISNDQTSLPITFASKVKQFLKT